MKKILLLLFFTVAANGQIVNFADANLKAKLIEADVNNPIADYRKIDTNNDGDIQVSEAIVINRLWLSGANIASISGLEAFTNLANLEIRYNFFTSLDFTAFHNLVQLDVTENTLLQSIDLTGLTSLNNFYCNYVPVATLDFSTLSALRYVEASYNNQLGSILFGSHPNLRFLICQFNPMLSNFEVGNLTTLEWLLCDAGNLGSLNTAALLNLKELRCDYNQLTTLNVSNLTQLEYLSFSSNQIASVDLSQLSQLNMLRVGDNNLSQIDLSGTPLLRGLELGNNPFTALDLSPVPNIDYLYIDAAQFPNLDVGMLADLKWLYVKRLPQANLDLTQNTLLETLQLQDSDITAIDLSQSTVVLQELNIHNNASLQFLNVKNGKPIGTFNLSHSPNLLQICIDEFNTVIPSMCGNPQIGSYCTFVPGGNYNTITGNVRLDTNNDGCDSNDFLLKYLRIGINDGLTTGSAFVNDTGIYNFYVQRPNLTLSPMLENPGYFNVTPATTTVNFPNNNQNTQTRDFCLTANGVQNDLEIVLSPIGALRPGFDQTYEVMYKNKGNQLASGSINFEFDDSAMDFVSATMAPVSQSFGNLSWNYANLQPFENRKFEIILNLNGPMETPSVNIGDDFASSATITALSSDEMFEDNTFTIREIVVGSFDPNEKICLQGVVVSSEQIGKFLHYRINFENTGTAQAENIVVKDVIDVAKYDLETLQLLSNSHPMVTKITGNKVEFIYEGIQLAAGGHGHVVFKIKTKSTLAVGSSVSNQADIFFDYNFPVVTDPAVTTFQVLGVEDFEIDDSITIFPNPATDFATVKASTAIQSVTLFDVQGRSLMTQLSMGFQVKLDTTAYPKGVYLIKVETLRGSRTEKLILK